jgi:tetratricopeptide (TPR) repeat protein
VQLFVQRARQVRRQFVLTHGEARDVARICRLVEGMPLAIELAAAGLRSRSPAGIAVVLERGVAALETASRAIPARHRSIRAVFEHSWQLLGMEERVIFAALSVFRGGFDAEAAAHVAEAAPETLALLVDKSLIRWDGTARYDLHELLRQYAGEKLEETARTEAAQRRHIRHYQKLAKEGERALWAHAQAATWLTRLSAEHDNFTVALAWSSESSNDHRLGLELAGGLGFYWLFRGHVHEGRRWLHSLLARQETGFTQQAGEGRYVRARALRAAAMLAEQLGELTEVRTMLDESVEIFQDLGEVRESALSQWFLAHLHWTEGTIARAAQLCEDSLRGHQAAGDLPGIGWCLWLLSNIAREDGDLQRAHTLAAGALTHARQQHLPVLVSYALFSVSRVQLASGDIAAARSTAAEAVALAREIGHRNVIPQILLQQGQVAHAEGDTDCASQNMEQALADARAINHLRVLAEVLLVLGRLEHQRGNQERALVLLTESLRLYRNRGHHRFVAECLLGFADVAHARGQAQRATRLLGAVSQLLVTSNVRSHSVDLQHGELLARTQTELTADIYAAAWEAGLAMSLEEAVAEAAALAAQNVASTLSEHCW